MPAMGAEMFSGDRVLMKPTNGMLGCCARTASGQVAAAPPNQRDELASLHCLPRGVGQLS